MDGDRTVEQLFLNEQRRPDDEQRGQGTTCFDNLAERGKARVKQRVLVKQVFVGIPRDTKLRKGHD